MSQSRTTYSTDSPAGLCALDGTALPLTRVVARGRLCGGIFEMSVEQHYRNAGRTNLETVYTFPLMPDAVLLGLELQIGERRLAGKALPVATARLNYEEALEDGNSAALLEKADDGLYTVSVGNLLAGESAFIRYTYAQPICAKNGLLRITIPTTVAPRYGNPAAKLQPHQVPESDVVAEYPFALTVQIDGEQNHAHIKSPTHAILLNTTGDTTAVVFPRASLDRDVVLLIQQTERPCVYIAQTDDGCIAYAPLAATLPGLSEQPSALSLRLVIDCSGSMAGASIKSARRGAMRVLESLTANDEISITRFGSTFEHYAPRLFKADATAMRHALNYLQSTDATLGGTEMAAALESASQLPGAATRSDVLLVTDGEIWAIDELLALARRSEMRYFIVGVGYSPSHDNLLRLADSTGGAYIAVTPGEDIEKAMESLLTRMSQPRISATRLHWATECQWQTALPPALFKQEAVALFAGLGAMPEGESAAVLQYGVDNISSDHRVIEITESLAVKPWMGDPALLRRMATAMRIRQLESGQVSSPVLTEAEATRLAVEHNLVSQYTNYLVVLEREEKDKPLDLPEVVSIKQMHLPLTDSDYRDIPAFLRRVDVDRSSDVGRSSIVEKAFACVDFVCNYSIADKLSGSFASALNKRMGKRNNGVVPTRIAVLVKLGLDDDIADVLRQLVRDGADESEAVIALLLLMADTGQLAELSDANLTILQGLSQQVDAGRLSYLQGVLSDVVEQGVSASRLS